MNNGSADRFRRQLIEDGYCHVPGVAPLDLIDRIREFADRAANELSDEEKERVRLQGSMIHVLELEEMLPLITLPAAIVLLGGMEYSNPKFSSGYIISKPPEVAPPLFWHQDGITWDEPLNYTEIPVQIFLMYYLIDTDRQNGCLRVIPGSHRKRHRLHGLPSAHAAEIQSVGENHPALQQDPDEIDVPVNAGDLVIGDARLIHSAHPNRSARRRTVITLWFLPIYDELPETLQAFYGKRNKKPTHWTDASWDELKPLLPVYEGDAQPSATNRVPDERLV